MNAKFYELLDEIIPDPKCSLQYTKDYELLLATILSAQCTDARVNIVTAELFSKYDIKSLASAKPEDIIDIIRPCGNMNKKSVFLVNVAKKLMEDYKGCVPNNREYLESLPGVGRKTANVVLANIFNVPAFAVDTHVERVSIRLGIAKSGDDILTIEKKLMRKFPKDKWNRMHHQLLLFGRHHCTSRAPQCKNCILSDYCKVKKSERNL